MATKYLAPNAAYAVVIGRYLYLDISYNASDQYDIIFKKGDSGFRRIIRTGSYGNFLDDPIDLEDLGDEYASGSYSLGSGNFNIEVFKNNSHDKNWYNVMFVRWESDITWNEPAQGKPLHVATNDDGLVCFTDKGVYRYNVDAIAFDEVGTYSMPSGTVTNDMIATASGVYLAATNGGLYMIHDDGQGYTWTHDPSYGTGDTFIAKCNGISIYSGIKYGLHAPGSASLKRTVTFIENIEPDNPDQPKEEDDSDSMNTAAWVGVSMTIVVVIAAIVLMAVFLPKSH